MKRSFPERRVRVTAPSRLHLGMFSFGQPGVRQFGGAGIMVDKPGLTLEARTADRFSVEGPYADRVIEFARRVAEAAKLPSELPCRLNVVSAPPQHVGLGTGTQLGLSVAAALVALFRDERPSGPELALLCGRGERSAVGTYGFERGGLVIESGKFASHDVSPLAAHVHLPKDWRFVLISPRDVSGLSGDAERAAFDNLPPVPRDVTGRLCEFALLRLLPAADEAKFDEFSDALYDFGTLAGNCFAACQAGPFASSRAAALVSRLRETGVKGAGQSSWGPTLFALSKNRVEASRLVEALQRNAENADLEFIVAAPNNRGAELALV